MRQPKRKDSDIIGVLKGEPDELTKRVHGDRAPHGLMIPIPTSGPSDMWVPIPKGAEIVPTGNGDEITARVYAPKSKLS